MQQKKDNQCDCHRGGERRRYTEIFPNRRRGAYAVKMLTPWEKELEMLEDWLNNLEPEDGFQERQSCQMEQNASMRSSWRKLECTNKGTDRS
jgi:hypothetical protein